MVNYSRMTLVYLSQMMDLKENDEKTWNMIYDDGRWFLCEKVGSALHINRRRSWNQIGKPLYKGNGWYKEHWQFQHKS